MLKKCYPLYLVLVIIIIYAVYTLLFPFIFLSFVLKKIASNRYFVHSFDSLVITLFFNTILCLFRVKIDIQNELPHKNLHDNNLIYISNHFSMFDIPILYKICPHRLRMLASDAVFHFPLFFFNFTMKTCNFLPLWITKKNARKNIETLERAHEMLAMNIPLWVAPGGFSSNSSRLNAFKSGAFKLAIKSNSVVIPVAIANADKILPSGNWLSLRPKFGVTVTLQVGTPIYANHYNGDTDRLKHDAHNVIDTLLNNVGADYSSINRAKLI